MLTKSGNGGKLSGFRIFLVSGEKYVQKMWKTLWIL